MTEKRGKRKEARQDDKSEHGLGVLKMAFYGRCVFGIYGGLS